MDAGAGSEAHDHAHGDASETRPGVVDATSGTGNTQSPDSTTGPSVEDPAADAAGSGTTDPEPTADAGSTDEPTQVDAIVFFFYL